MYVAALVFQLPDVFLILNPLERMSMSPTDVATSASFVFGNNLCGAAFDGLLAAS
jgi:hypothetical protein